MAYTFLSCQGHKIGKSLVEPDFLDVVGEFLGDEGYAVATALNGRAALDILAAGPAFDLLLSDINMPGMSGFEFIEHMTNHGCKAMAQNKAVMSGHLSNEALSTAKRLGCQTFQKPIRKDELFAWLDKCEKRIDPSRKLVDLANLLPQA